MDITEENAPPDIPVLILRFLNLVETSRKAEEPFPLSDMLYYTDANAPLTLYDDIASEVDGEGMIYPEWYSDWVDTMSKSLCVQISRHDTKPLLAVAELNDFRKAKNEEELQRDLRPYLGRITAKRLMSMKETGVYLNTNF